MISLLQVNRFINRTGIVFFLMMLPLSVRAATLRGQVVIESRSGEGPRFVFLERLDGPSPLESSTFQLVQRGKLFDPLANRIVHSRAKGCRLRRFNPIKPTARPPLAFEHPQDYLERGA